MANESAAITENSSMVMESIQEWCCDVVSSWVIIVLLYLNIFNAKKKNICNQPKLKN